MSRVVLSSHFRHADGAQACSYCVDILQFSERAEQSSLLSITSTIQNQSSAVTLSRSSNLDDFQ